jgi:hypothetical protein
MKNISLFCFCLIYYGLVSQNQIGLNDSFEAQLIRKYGCSAHVFHNTDYALIKRNDTLYDIIDKKFEYKTSSKDSKVAILPNHLAIIKNDTGRIVFDLKARKQVSRTYKYIIASGVNFIASDDEIHYDLLGNDFVKISTIQYNNIVEVKKWCFKTEIDKKQGLIDCKGNQILPNEYESIFSMHSGPKWVAIKSGRTYLYDSLDLIAQVDSLYCVFDFNENYAIICPNKFISNKKKPKFGLVDFNHKLIIPFRFESIKMYHQYFQCFDGNSYSYYDTGGTLIVDHSKFNIKTESNLLKAKMYNEGDYYGLITDQGVKLTKAVYYPLKQMDQTGYWKGYNQNSSQHEYFTPAGEKLLFKAELIEMDANGNAMITENGKFGLQKLNGQILLEIIYDKIQICHEFEHHTNTIYQVYYIVLKDGIYQILNQDAKLINNNSWNLAMSCPKSGMMSLYKGDKFLLSDLKGKILISEEFDEIVIEDSTLIRLKSEGINKIYNRKMNQVICEQFDDFIFESTNPYLVVSKNSKYGIINLEGEIILPFEFAKIKPSDIYLVVYNSKQLCGLYDQSGKQLLPHEYKDIKVFGLGKRIEVLDLKGNQKEIDILGQNYDDWKREL